MPTTITHAMSSRMLINYNLVEFDGMAKVECTTDEALIRVPTHNHQKSVVLQELTSIHLR